MHVRIRAWRRAGLVAGLIGLSACTREIPVPNVGECTEYPARAYDYGDFSIGDCLGAPTDVEFYEGPDGPVLMVVNSDAYLVFGDGSLLNLDWDSLASRIDTLRDEEGGDPYEEDPFPVVVLTSDPEVERGTLSLPHYSGRVVVGTVPTPEGGERPVAFISNRLSRTTDDFGLDYIYAVDLSDPLKPVPFDVTTRQPASADTTAAALQVGEDPFGMAFARTEKGSYLYVVNQTAHSVSVIDVGGDPSEPIQPLEGSATSLVSFPNRADFEDSGAPSFPAFSTISVGEGTPSQKWALSYYEGTYRLYFRGEGAGTDQIGLATGGDGLSFRTLATSPVLSQGEGVAWDADGIGRSTLLVSGSTSYLLYEGYKEVEGLGRITRIGYAVSSLDLAASYIKYDVSSDTTTANDFVVDRGQPGAFDELGVTSPWILGDPSSLVLWYAGEDSQRQRKLGRVISSDLNKWTDRSVLTLEGGDAGDEQLDPTGYYDLELGRYRLWFVKRDGAGECLMYAESTDGLSFTLGGFDGGPSGCLTLPADGVVRSPTVVLSDRVLNLWYVSASSEDSDVWTFHHARGFNGINWTVQGSTVLEDGSSWQGGNPMPMVAMPSAGDADAGLRLEGDTYGLWQSGMPLQQLVQPSSLQMAFAVFEGPVLAVGDRGRYAIADNTFSGGTWDSQQVGSPGFDPVDGSLYYSASSVNSSSSSWTNSQLSPQAAIGLAPRAPGELLYWNNGTCSSLPSATGDCSSTLPTEGFSDPEVIRSGGKVWMYFSHAPSTGDSSALQVITRAEGASSWDNSSLKTLLSPRGDLGETHLRAPSVLMPSGGVSTWHMWFTVVGTGGSRIGHATSSDGLSWSRDADGILSLSVSSGGQWDDDAVASPSVVRDEQGGYHLWYAGSGGADVYRIGYAYAGPTEVDSRGSPLWTRYYDSVSRSAVPVLDHEADFWDAGSVNHPQVTWMGDRFWMFYQGERSGQRRIGLAESWDGIHWTRIFQPLSTGDTFRFETRLVSNADGESPTGLLDGTLSLDVSLGSYYMCGLGATEIALAPDNSIAVISALYSPGVYVVDTRDDSTLTTFDANYHSFEAVISLQESSACGPSASTPLRGTRSILFNASGDRFFMTTKLPDGVLVFDRTRIEDQADGRLLREGPLLGVINLDPGSVEDQGNMTEGDLGPIGLQLSHDERFLWAANANGNSVFSIELGKEGLGAVSHVARQVGEVPADLALSPDGRYLVVANYVGEIEETSDERLVPHATLSIIDAVPDSPTFGRVVAYVKNLELGLREVTP